MVGDLGALEKAKLSLDDWVAEGRAIPRAKEVLETFLLQHDARVSSVQVSLALCWLGDAESVPALVEALGSPNAVTRNFAAAALGRIGGSDAIGALCAVLMEDPSRMVRATAASSLTSFATGGGSADAMACLRKALDDPDTEIRQIAREALEKQVPSGSSTHS